MNLNIRSNSMSGKFFVCKTLHSIVGPRKEYPFFIHVFSLKYLDIFAYEKCLSID